MKKIVITQFGILAAVSGTIAVLTFFTGGMAANHWAEIFDGGKVTPPAVTVFASHYGYLIPLGCCVASIISIVIALKREGDLISRWQLFTLVVIIELIGLALIALFNMFPALKIMYKLM